MKAWKGSGFAEVDRREAFSWIRLRTLPSGVNALDEVGDGERRVLAGVDELQTGAIGNVLGPHSANAAVNDSRFGDNGVGAKAQS
jgi:hypothetical protein